MIAACIRVAAMLTAAPSAWPRHVGADGHGWPKSTVPPVVVAPVVLADGVYGAPGLDASMLDPTIVGWA